MTVFQTYRWGIMRAVLSVFPFLTGAIVRIVTVVRVVIIRGCMTLEE